MEGGMRMAWFSVLSAALFRCAIPLCCPLRCCSALLCCALTYCAMVRGGGGGRGSGNDERQEWRCSRWHT
jgi:hypothetical protein